MQQEPEITYVCFECWEKNWKVINKISPYNNDFCDICWNYKRITHIRAFNYLSKVEYENNTIVPKTVRNTN